MDNMELAEFSKAIAVLPFANQSGKPEQEYLSDGLTEEIINALSQIEGLKVTSRTSSFYFKEQQQSLPDIAAALGVEIVVEGSVRLAGKQMRVTARLIEVSQDMQLWSQTFDRSIQDLFAVQDEISLSIADQLREQLGHLEFDDDLLPRPKASVESYQMYLRARYHLLKMGKADIEKGLGILEDILRHDPDYAHAHLGIHLGYTLLGTLGLVPAMKAFAAGQPHLEQAIALQPELPECQINQAWNAFLQEQDLAKTYRHLQQAAHIRPTTDYYQTMTSILVAEGRFKAAHHYIDIAIDIDPFSHIAYHLKGFIYYCEEKQEEAQRMFDRSLELNPHATVSLLYKGQSLIAMQQVEKSLQFFQTLPADEPGDIIKLGGVTLSLAARGQHTHTEEMAREIATKTSTDLMGRATQLLVMIHTQLGQYEQALQWMERGIQRKLPLLIYLFTDPLLKPLYADPRFQKWKQAILGPPVELKTAKRKYKQSLLNAEEIQMHKERLQQIMLGERPFLDPKMTLRELAKLLQIPANQLSQLLNEGFQQNFAEFINTYRLESFKQRVADPKQQHLTLLALAYDSGFNSKTVFNTFFKKKMGKTPRQYWQEVVGKG